MARDFCWICDELARLHQDLQAIRERERAEAAQGAAPAEPMQDDAEPNRAEVTP